MHIVWPFALCTYYNAWHAWMRRRWQLGVVVPCALLCVLNFTVAILAQGTYWAVASLQAFLHPPYGMRALRGGTWWRHPQHCKPCSWRRPLLTRRGRLDSHGAGFFFLRCVNASDESIHLSCPEQASSALCRPLMACVRVSPALPAQVAPRQLSVASIQMALPCTCAFL